MSLNKVNWNEEHHLHNVNYVWCPLCRARKDGEDNPQQHLVPPQQDPSQAGMAYLKEDYDPAVVHAAHITTGTVPEKAGPYVKGKGFETE